MVFLGTGTPLPDPDRAGAGTAIVVNGRSYLFDAGPGIVRRASAAARMGVAGLDAVDLRIVFLTHLHSDHTMGLPDLILTPWVMGRQVPLDVYGPAGVRRMTDGIMAAWAEDIDHRLHDLQPSPPEGYRVTVHEVEAGVVYTDENVTVTAIPVLHGAWTAFGYRIQTPDKVVVISGDARPTPALVEACNGCDILIHEVYTEGSTARVTPDWRAYREAYHTSTRELAEIATRARPTLLVLHHRANPGCDQVGTNCGASGSEEEALAEIRGAYAGQVVEAHDLDVF
ncbi:MAG: MBL fold metallo-hydrolase [Acidobacteria bacterium]|nr:MBL fold metallo-hydrolase [Acidobacteriota bacterium]